MKKCLAVAAILLALLGSCTTATQSGGDVASLIVGTWLSGSSEQTFVFATDYSVNVTGAVPDTGTWSSSGSSLHIVWSNSSTTDPTVTFSNSDATMTWTYPPASTTVITFTRQ